MSEQIKFFNDDAESIYKNLLTKVESELNEGLYPGDKRRIFCEAVALAMTSLFADANEKGKQLFLRTATGEYLDLHGYERNCARITGSKAKTTLRFSVKNALSYNVLIPIGTRCSIDGFYFATDETTYIPAGDLYIDINATCTVIGSDSNNYAIGTIKTIVDSVEYIDSVTNLTVTGGGDDYESDDSYRERIRTAGGQYSAGTESQYISLAKASNTTISDVKIDTDHEAGTVKIILLCEGGKLPTDSIINGALESCNNKEKRPENDLVSVEKPTEVFYNIDIKVYTTIENKADAVVWIEGNGKEENFGNGCLNDFITWQHQVLGRDINPTELVAYCKDGKATDGSRLVKRIDVTEPTYQNLSIRQIAKWSGNANIVYVEEDE